MLDKVSKLLAKYRLIGIRGSFVAEDAMKRIAKNEKRIRALLDGKQGGSMRVRVPSILGRGLSKKPLTFFLLAVMIMSLIGMAAMWNYSRAVQKVSMPIAPTVSARNTEPLLTKWIYDHSKQISKEACKEIAEECLKTNKPLALLAIMEAESNFVPTAVSSKGAIGLGQIMPGVHEKELIGRGIIKERRDLFDITPNIRATHHIFSMCLTQSKGDVPKALEMYLGGQDGAYVKRILSNLANLYIISESGQYTEVAVEKSKMTSNASLSVRAH